MPLKNSEFLTLQDVAARLKISKNTAYALARDGSLKAFKAGRQWRVREEDFTEFTNEREANQSRGTDGDDPLDHYLGRR